MVLLPFAAVFGTDTPDNLIIKIYGAAAVLFLYHALKKVSPCRAEAAVWSFLAVFSSSLLPLTLEGAVWYQAQALALALVTGSMYFLTADRMTAALVMYALSVAARPFDALFFFPVMGTWLTIYRRAGIPFAGMKRKLVPGFCLGLCVAALIGAYNALRFGNPLEFGHNYLPEFSFQGGVQFSLSHVMNNVRTFVTGLPFDSSGDGIALKRFGFTFLIACPVLTLFIIWAVSDPVRKRTDIARALTVAFFLIHFLLLLTHRTFGGYQFGARYCIDLLPYAFLYRLLQKEKKAAPVWEWVLLGAGFVFCVYGTLQVHL